MEPARQRERHGRGRNQRELANILGKAPNRARPKRPRASASERLAASRSVASDVAEVTALVTEALCNSQPPRRRVGRALLLHLPVCPASHFNHC